MKKLCPTFSETRNWKGKVERDYKLSPAELKKIEAEVLERDKYTCYYCKFSAKKYQTINHIDGDISNYKKSNLVTVCPMCKLILNADYGCRIEGILELYKQANCSQVKIIQATRELRKEGRSDQFIQRELGLKDKVPFKRDRVYLERLFGFVSSWKGSLGRAEEALLFGYK